MAYYICNKLSDSNGEHEIHVSNCPFLPALENRVFVGNYPEVYQAIRHLKTKYAKQYFIFYGCPFCCYLSNER
jgi:hypothetical protein